MTVYSGLLLCVSVLFCHWRVKAEPVTYFYSHLPPYELTNANGDASGVGIEKVRQILQAAGFQPEFQFFSVGRGLNALHHNIDFTAIVAPTARQRQQFLMSQLPIYQVGIGVVRLSSTPALQSLTQLSDSAYLVLAETKFSYLHSRDELRQLSAMRYEVATLQDAFRLIQSGRYKYFLCYALTEAEINNFFIHFDLLERHSVHLVLSKQHPEGKRLMQRVDAVLATQH